MVVILEGEKKVPAFGPYASATSAVCTRCPQVKNGKFQALSSNSSKMTAAKRSNAVMQTISFAYQAGSENLTNLFG
jgi:hypothetical protein